MNARIKPITDKDHWGVVDRWEFPDDGKGDCEDYQLLKRKMLAERGLPRRAMRMTVVIDELGEGHAVLMIRTDRGDYILDNKTSAVLPWDQTGYVYVKRESQDGRPGCRSADAPRRRRPPTAEPGVRDRPRRPRGFLRGGSVAVPEGRDADQSIRRKPAAKRFQFST